MFAKTPLLQRGGWREGDLVGGWLLGSMITLGVQAGDPRHASLAGPGLSPCPGAGDGGQPPHLSRPRSDHKSQVSPHNLPIFNIIGFLWCAGNILTERTLYSVECWSCVCSDYINLSPVRQNSFLLSLKIATLRDAGAEAEGLIS